MVEEFDEAGEVGAGFLLLDALVLLALDGREEGEGVLVLRVRGEGEDFVVRQFGAFGVRSVHFGFEKVENEVKIEIFSVVKTISNEPSQTIKSVKIHFSKRKTLNL